VGNLYGAEGSEAMKEALRHKEAFEFFYSLDGRPTAENCRRVADKLQISERTFWNWYKELSWKLRVEQRDIENAKKVEQKTNSEVVDAKADFRRTIFAVHQTLKKSLNEYIKKNDVVQIVDIKDLLKAVIILDRLARLDMGLVGENIEGEKELKVPGLEDLFLKIAEYERVFKDDEQGKSNISGNSSGKQVDSSQADPETGEVSGS
jgi:hypothetical protein